MHRMNSSKPNKNFQICALLSGFIFFCPLSGCVIITTPTDGSGSNGSDNGSQNGNGSDGNPTGDVLAVELTASNINPQVGEEVTLSCTIVSGQTNDLGQPIDPVFEFQPTDRLIDIDTTNGTAIFLIDETDTGIEFSFTCSVTDASIIDTNIPDTAAASDPSPPVSIIPTATVAP